MKSRMDTQKGINFAEFTYQLLQSYDFWHLYRHEDCRLQVKGILAFLTPLETYSNSRVSKRLAEMINMETSPLAST